MILDFVRPILYSCLAGCKCLCCTCMVVSLNAFLVKSSCLSLQELRPAFDTILVLPFILSEVSVESSKRDPENVLIVVKVISWESWQRIAREIRPAVPLLRI